MWHFDDYLVDQQLKEINGRMYYEPAAWVEHYYYLSLRERISLAYRYGRAEFTEEHPSFAVASLSLIDKWRRLLREYHEISASERLWYAMTQPIVWLARRAGRVRGLILFVSSKRRADPL